MSGYTYIQCPKCGKIVAEGYEDGEMTDTPCECVPEPADIVNTIFKIVVASLLGFSVGIGVFILFVYLFIM